MLPIQIAVGLAMGLTVGVIFTETLATILPVHPAISVPITV